MSVNGRIGPTTFVAHGGFAFCHNYEHRARVLSLRRQRHRNSNALSGRHSYAATRATTVHSPIGDRPMTVSGCAFPLDGGAPPRPLIRHTSHSFTTEEPIVIAVIGLIIGIVLGILLVPAWLAPFPTRCRCRRLGHCSGRA